MSGKTDKRFEEWEEVTCNDCEHYWDNSCDGIRNGSGKLCNSFKVTRGVIVPEQIEELQANVKGLICWLVVVAALTLSTLGMLLAVIING